jgi:uncharacterized protein (UPF0332 family)
VTEENRRKNIAAEVRRGGEALESAEILLRAGKYSDAISRAYYAVFHYARALLLMMGEEARTHAGVERLLQRDLVREGRMDPDVARLFSRLLQYRIDADYASEYVFTERSAMEELDAAERFIAAARQLLIDGGWLSA